MSEKQKIAVNIERVSRIFEKILKILEKKTKSPVEALMVMKFGVAFFEILLGVKSSDDSEIRAFIKARMEEVVEHQKRKRGNKP